MKLLIWVTLFFYLLGTVSASTIFYDGFESGNLSGWNLDPSTNGVNWTDSQSDVYAGNWSAQSHTLSASLSTMTKSINATGYLNITLSYYRKLVGLDASDRFRARWFDGSNWVSVEDTSGTAVNNSNYVFMNFSLPANVYNNPQFAIRFDCNAQSSDEYCRVDDVLVTGQPIIPLTNYIGFFDYMPGQTYSVFIDQNAGHVVFTGSNISNQNVVFIVPILPYYSQNHLSKRINYVWFDGWFDNQSLYLNQYVGINSTVTAPAVQLSNPDLYYSSLIIPGIPYLGLSNEPVDVTINSVAGMSKLYPIAYPLSLVSYSFIDSIWNTAGHAYGPELFETRLIQAGNSSTISVSQWVKEDLGYNGMNPKWTVPLTVA